MRTLSGGRRVALPISAIVPVIALSLAGVLAAGLVASPGRAGPTPEEEFVAADRALDPTLPGLGPDPAAPDDEAREDAAATALYVSAHAIRAARGNEDSRRKVVAGADRLLALAIRDDHGAALGWGLPFQWDAFSDGTVNPPATAYAITTALAAKALLDADEVLEAQTYLGTAVAALEAYRRSFTATDQGGFFWYSDALTDAHFVDNVSAMMAGQLARAGRTADRPALVRLARQAANSIVARARRDARGVYWSYSGGELVNDAVHAAYTLEGLETVAKYAGPVGFDRSSAYDYLRTFRRPEGGVARFVGQPEAARAWGVAYLAYVMCTGAADVPEGRRFLEALRAYAYARGRYSRFPGERIMYPRQQTHVLLALAACQP